MLRLLRTIHDSSYSIVCRSIQTNTEEKVILGQKAFFFLFWLTFQLYMQLTFDVNLKCFRRFGYLVGTKLLCLKLYDGIAFIGINMYFNQNVLRCRFFIKIFFNEFRIPNLQTYSEIVFVEIQNCF